MVNQSFHTVSGGSGCFEFWFLFFIFYFYFYFYFIYISPFYFLKWNRYFSTCERKFAKFFMSFLKIQVSFPSNFASILVLSNITAWYFFNSNITYLGQKQLIKVQIFEIFECSGQNSLNSPFQFWTDKSIPLQFLHHSSLSWQITLL